MERLDVFDPSNISITSYHTDEQECTHCNREHTLVYVHTGRLDITEHTRTTTLRAGECAFMRRDNHLLLRKIPEDGLQYHSIELKFTRDFLREFYQHLKQREIPKNAVRSRGSLYLLPSNRDDIRILFESLIQYFDAETKPSDEILRLKMVEGLYAILKTDENLYASLFDFVDRWKIDIMVFLEKNYMNDLTLRDIARFTGRSLSTFKRDFRALSDLTPQRWLMRRRLEAAREMLRRDSKRKVTDVCFEVGFKNLSHFSKLYKRTYGIPPTEEPAEEAVAAEGI